MIMLLVALIVGCIAAFMLFSYAGDGYGGLHDAACLAGVLLSIGLGISAICYVFAGWSWLAAEQKTNILNREYGTGYSQKEVFYASDVIDTVRQLDRKRIEVNGDLLKEDKPKD